MAQAVGSTLKAVLVKAGGGGGALGFGSSRTAGHLSVTVGVMLLLPMLFIRTV